MARKLFTKEEIEAYLNSTQSKKNETIESKMIDAIVEVENPLDQLRALSTLGKFSNNSFLISAKRPVDFYDEKIQMAFKVLLNSFYEALEKADVAEVKKQIIHSHMNQALLGFEEKMEKMTKGIITDALKKEVDLSNNYLKEMDRDSKVIEVEVKDNKRNPRRSGKSRNRLRGKKR